MFSCLCPVQSRAACCCSALFCMRRRPARSLSVCWRRTASARATPPRCAHFTAPYPRWPSPRWLRRHTPVSYTHLDVYKRQQLSTGLLSMSALRACQRLSLSRRYSIGVIPQNFLNAALILLADGKSVSAAISAIGISVHNRSLAYERCCKET